ncbi:MAG TPA: M20/M25/M40 family metallo-hydrolase [Candidatus Acidoferrales bacterium]|nr:M20/M25/M40 family metallo-hydrolase [Candidatus Acidoferrales bacterium]
MQDYPVQLLQAMLEHYSPSGSEAEIAHFLRDEMQDKGMNSTLDEAGNVIGVLGEEGPRILLCGHMDTVSGHIPIRLDGDLLYGRGAVDAKASLAAMIVGAIAAKEKGRAPARITVAGVVEEETSSKGIRALIGGKTSYDLAVFGEPSGTSNVIVGYKGSLKLHLTFRTFGGHSASPWLSESSFEESYAFWSEFRRQMLNNNAESKFEAITGCVTNMVAGGSGNSVPANAILEIDVRIPPSVHSETLASNVREFIERYSAGRKDVTVDLRVDDQTEAFLGLTESDALSAFRWAIRKVRGGQVALLKKTGTSDINLFAQTQRIPMFAYGPGDSRLDHTQTEHVRISEYLACIEVYAQAIARLAERAGETRLPPAAAK